MILVVGSTGTIGREVVRALAARRKEYRPGRAGRAYAAFARENVAAFR